MSVIYLILAIILSGCDPTHHSYDFKLELESRLITDEADNNE